MYLFRVKKENRSSFTGNAISPRRTLFSAHYASHPVASFVVRKASVINCFFVNVESCPPYFSIVVSPISFFTNMANGKQTKKHIWNIYKRKIFIPYFLLVWMYERLPAILFMFRCKAHRYFHHLPQLLNIGFYGLFSYIKWFVFCSHSSPICGVVRRYD